MSRYSKEGLEEINRYLEFYGKKMDEESIERKFVEYGINVNKSFTKLVKKFGKKFKDTTKKEDIADYNKFDWAALDAVIESIPANIERVELKNNDILLIYN